MKITSNSFKSFLVLVIGTTLLVFSGLNWHNAIAAWLAPVFLLYYTRKSDWKGFLIFLVLIFFAGIFSQTRGNVMELFIVHIINGLSTCIIYGTLYAADKLLYKRRSGFIYTLTFPTLLVLLEFVIALNMGTWGIIAHTQYPFPAFLQIVSVLGPFSISFLVGWTAAVINWIYEHKGNYGNTVRGAIIISSVIVFTVVFGLLRLKNTGNEKEDVLVALVPGVTDIHAIGMEEKDILFNYDPGSEIQIPERVYASENQIQSMLDRTQAAVRNHAKIVTWSEDALLLNREQKDTLFQQIKEIAVSSKAYILPAILEEAEEETEFPFNNTSILITPGGEVAWEYHKSYLHPQGEKPIINPGDFKMPVIETEYGILGNSICVDLDRTDYTIQAGKKGVSILLVPSFDWKGIDPLHSEMARIEAIRNGCAIVRPNGNGRSAVYDAFGNEVALTEMNDDASEVYLANLPLYKINTLSPKIGPVIEIACFALLVLFVLLRIIKRKK